jgi:chemotaxis protein CheD
MTGLKKYTIFPGQFVITSVPTLITTVLGSCVSVCLWDTKNKTGGMNHYLLPGTAEDEADNANRGIAAIPLLIRSMINRQAKVENIEAKIFGGCNSLYRNHDVFRVGERNAIIAFEILQDHGIRVAAQHVGGSVGRKIVFNTATGKVRMRLLTKTAAEINEEIHKGFGY